MWWDCEHPAIAIVPAKLGKSRLGFCRKHKPGGLRIGEWYYGIQPVTDADDFCGEFREDS